jgi:hypothetical protein
MQGLAAVAGIISNLSATAGGLAAIAAIIMGHLALNQSQRYPPWRAWRGLAVAGVVLGYLSAAFLVGAISLVLVADIHLF